jgi:hypothetical protein
MVPTITTPFLQFARAALLAVLMLCVSAAILRADEALPGPKHCRMYFGCVPAFAKTGVPLN